MSRLACKVALLTIALCLLAVAPAFATTHYATPNGAAIDDTGCPAILPCSITEAVNSPLWAANGDEVVLLPGEYSFSTQLIINKGLNVHGTGNPADTILTSNITLPIEINNADATLSHVTVNQTNSTNISGINLTNGTVRNSIVESQAGIGINVKVGTITDTISIAHGNGSLGYGGGGITSSYPTAGLTAVLTLRNVTAIGKGSSYSDGLFIRADGPGSVVVNARSSIFVGGPNANSYDIFGNNVGGSATVVADHSNYSTFGAVNAGTVSFTDPTTNGNQTGEVIFEDDDSDNYHLWKSTDNAIDLGVVDGTSGSTDVDGDARTQGAAPDIGADEIDIVPPSTPVITSPTSGQVVKPGFSVTGTAEPDSHVWGDGGPGISLCDGVTDSSGFFTCPSIQLPDGPYAVSVNAHDQADNTSLQTAVVPITVDSVAPVVSIASPASGATASSFTTSFTVGELHPGLTECRVDGAAFAPCSSGGALGAGLADGAHTLAVRNTDAAGNVGAANATFTIDATGPVVKKKSVKTKKGKSTVTFKANETSKFTCKLDKAKAKTCKSPYKTKKLKKGKHKLKIVGTDAVGNTGGLTISWKVK